MKIDCLAKILITTYITIFTARLALGGSFFSCCVLLDNINMYGSFDEQNKYLLQRPKGAEKQATESESS